MDSSECPVCLNGWSLPGNLPMKFRCNHHVCAECLGKMVCEAFPYGKRCPLCRRVSMNTALDGEMPLTTECGLTTSVRDISRAHLDACDSCWRVVGDDVNKCLQKEDLVNFTRWLRLGSAPTQDVALASVSRAGYDIISAWIPHVDVTFDMIMRACERADKRVVNALAGAYDVTHGCELRMLYQYGHEDILLRLWARGGRDLKLIEPLVKDDNARVLMQVYSSECIIPTSAIFAPACSQALLDVGRPTANIHLPQVDEASLGQLFQVLMLATVVEGRLLGVNPYGQPGVEAYKRNMYRILGMG